MQTLLAVAFVLACAAAARADLRADLSRVFVSADGRAKLLGLRGMEPYPLIVFHERYRFRTLIFGIRLYELADYRFDRPAETAVTLDDGLVAPASPSALYEEPECSFRVRETPEGPVVVSAALPPPPRRWRATGQFRPLDPFPPDVIVGRIEPDGWMSPLVALPSVQDGWRFAYDPFSNAVMRVHKGAAFGPVDGHSPRAVTLGARELVLRDATGRPLKGARLDLGRLPAEPEPVLTLDHAGVRRPIGVSTPRERTLTRYLRGLPGQPISIERVQFPLQVFRAEGVILRPDGIQLAPAEVLAPPLRSVAAGGSSNSPRH